MDGWSRCPTPTKTGWPTRQKSLPPAISRYSADGKFEKVYAKGLRNAVGILFHPITGELWATDNGRDLIGDDVPPETIYNVKEDTDYGWPYCYGNRVPDKTQDVPA